MNSQPDSPALAWLERASPEQRTTLYRLFCKAAELGRMAIEAEQLDKEKTPNRDERLASIEEQKVDGILTPQRSISQRTPTPQQVVEVLKTLPEDAALDLLHTCWHCWGLTPKLLLTALCYLKPHAPRDGQEASA